MTDQPPDLPPDQQDLSAAGHEEGEPEAAALPSWVPVLIGVTLVVLAGLAVYTGLQYRDESFGGHVRTRRAPMNAAAPPGEPGAGASLVLHGAGGENTPTAGEPVEGEARAVISGGPGGVESTVRMWARRGMLLDVVPDDAVVYVNDLPIGEANQFNTVDEIYDFPEAGSYTVRLDAPGYREKRFIVSADPNAKDDVAHVSVKLAKQ